jgi:hypothetical protein
MPIALQPRFPIPDRSKQPVRSEKDEDGVIDIGWCDGVLSDGRPFRAEMWAQDHVSCLTFFFSTKGIENLDDDAICCRFVEAEQLVLFKKPDWQRYCAATRYTDDAGNEVWSLNIAIGDDEDTFVKKSIPIFGYSKIGEPNTMFNLTPIKAAHSH